MVDLVESTGDSRTTQTDSSTRPTGVGAPEGPRTGGGDPRTDSSGGVQRHVHVMRRVSCVGSGDD